MAYTGSRSYNEHKRYNINQAQPGHDADRDARAVSGVPVGDSLLVRRGLGRASTACRSALEKRYSDGLFFLGNYQLSKSTDNGSGEIEANDTAFALESERRRGLRALRSASPRRGQLRLRVAVRAGQAVAVERRRGGVRVRRLAGAGHRPAGDRDSRSP